MKKQSPEKKARSFGLSVGGVLILEPRVAQPQEQPAGSRAKVQDAGAMRSPRAQEVHQRGVRTGSAAKHQPLVPLHVPPHPSTAQESHSFMIPRLPGAV